MFCHKKSRRGTGRIKCIERCFAVDCSTWLLGCTGILSRCWLCSVDTTKLVYIGACSSTQMLILNKQLYSQLALKLPLGGAKSHHSQHWRATCVQVLPWQTAHSSGSIARCFKLPVQEGPRSLLEFENLAKEKEEETGPVIRKTSLVGFSPLTTSWFLQQLETRVSLL